MPDLDRFLDAQADTFATALAELEAGEKQSHWMWFIFPQLRGLGHSSTARFYGIEDRAEAAAYLAHPTLGPRLIACCEALLAHRDKSAHDIFGSPDDLKLCSCVTLFRAVADDAAPFADVLEHFHNGQPDERTLELLGA